MRTLRATILQAAPPWLRRYWGSRLLYSIGVHFDALVDLTAQSLRVRFPDYAPPDALSALGRDRQIRRGFDESDASYATRLKRWIPDRITRGNPYTLMRQIQGYLSGHSVRVRIVNNAGVWHTLYADGTTDFHYSATNWDWDGDADPWWRFWIIIHPQTSLWNGDGAWGSPGTWGDGGQWGINATQAQADTIASLIREWKAQHSRCHGVIISWDMAFDPTHPGGTSDFPNGTWGRSGKSDGLGGYVLARKLSLRFTGPIV